MNRFPLRHLLPSFAVVSLTMGSALIGCGGNTPEPNVAKTETTTSWQTDQTVNEGKPTPATAPTTVTAPQVNQAVDPSSKPAAPAALTDEQILEIIRTANSGEIDQAQVAKSKVKDARVNKYAEVMSKDHTDADSKAVELSKKKSFARSTSAASTSLDSDTKEMTASMSSQTGADFDKAYIDAQVKEHTAVLDMLDSKLIPSAQAPELKTYLEGVRAKVAHHLSDARDLQKKIK